MIMTGASLSSFLLSVELTDLTDVRLLFSPTYEPSPVMWMTLLTKWMTTRSHFPWMWRDGWDADQWSLTSAGTWSSIMVKSMVCPLKTRRPIRSRHSWNILDNFFKAICCKCFTKNVTREKHVVHSFLLHVWASTTGKHSSFGHPPAWRTRSKPCHAACLVSLCATPLIYLYALKLCWQDVVKWEAISQTNMKSKNSVLLTNTSN